MRVIRRLACTTLIALLPGTLSQAQSVSLQTLVTPSTTMVKDGKAVPFAVHGFVEFHSLAELFPTLSHKRNAGVSVEHSMTPSSSCSRKAFLPAESRVAWFR